MKPSFRAQLLDYLSLSGTGTRWSGNWHGLDEASWRRELRFTDSAGLTLYLWEKLQQLGHSANLPDQIRKALIQRQRDNSERVAVMRSEFLEFNRRLKSAGIRYLNLKGFMLHPDLVGPPEQRAQFDYDFLIAEPDLQTAYHVFRDLGYSFLHRSARVVEDHLPTLVQRTDWKWSSNFFDPAMPRRVELHFQLWDAPFERIPVHSLNHIWEQSRLRNFLGLSVPTLPSTHALLYTVLHIFRHLLRSDLRLSHLYELASFLHRSGSQAQFWDEVLRLTADCSKSQQALASVVQLAESVFGGDLPRSLEPFLKQHLPASADLWIRQFGRKDALHCYRHNRHALLLHLSFLDRTQDQLAVLGHRLIPRHLPLSRYGVERPPQGQPVLFQITRRLSYGGLLLARCAFWGRTLVALICQLPLWTYRLWRTRAKESFRTASNRSQPVRSRGDR